MTLQEFCFKHKIVAGGAEFRRLLFLKQIKINGVPADSGDIEINNGDMILKGKKNLFIKSETIAEGFKVMPLNLNGVYCTVITDIEE